MAGFGDYGAPIPGLTPAQQSAMTQGGSQTQTDDSSHQGLFGKIKNKFTPMQNWKDLYQADMAKLQHPDQLGLSETQRQAMINQATQAANAQQQGAITQLNQSALGGQGFQAGAFQQAAQGIADKGTDAAAKAAVGVNQLNAQMVDQEKQRIFQEMDAARGRAREDQQFWRQLGIDSVAGLIGFAVGGPAGAGLGIDMVGGAAGGSAPDAAGSAAASSSGLA